LARKAGIWSALLIGIVFLVEIDQIGPRDLIQHFRVVRPLFPLLFEEHARLGGLALPQKQERRPQWSGLLGQGRRGKSRWLLAPDSRDNDCGQQCKQQGY
jgi:hypothetical protein